MESLDFGNVLRVKVEVAFTGERSQRVHLLNAFPVGEKRNSHFYNGSCPWNMRKITFEIAGDGQLLHSKR